MVLDADEGEVPSLSRGQVITWVLTATRIPFIMGKTSRLAPQTWEPFVTQALLFTGQSNLIVSSFLS
jgi:hypothetical protein